MKGKRGTVLMLSAALCLGGMLPGCGTSKDETGKESPGASASDSSQAGTKEYYGNDISEHKELTMYVIGDEPASADEVEAAINEKLEEKANAALDITYISLSDYTTKYSLLLASGEDIDIIYSSEWAGYFEEARKGAYLEITEDMISQYMPQTSEGQDPDSYDSVGVNGKRYMIPLNSVYAGNAVPVLIRGDLREKYGMGEINSYEGLLEYMETVAENEEGIYPYAAATDGVELSIQMYQCRYGLRASTSLAKYIGYYFDGTNNSPDADDLVWQYTTDEYREYVNDAKTWADQGFWSKNAVSNTIAPSDAFINGTSAVVFWNYDTCMTIYNTVMEEHPEWKPELVDLNPGGVRYKTAFTQGLSIPATASEPERSMIVMDLLKWDKEIYDIARYGIEGKNWIETSDTTYQFGEEQGNYTVGNSPITWGTKNDKLERILGDAGAEQPEIYQELFSDPVSESLTPFIFDDSGVKSEIAALSELCSQYIPILELGLVDDPDSTLDEFNEKCEAAGKERVFEEFKKQYTEYLENR